MSHIRQQILDILSCQDGIVSGDRLAGKLSLSRTAVWKHIHHLKNQGIGIESVAGKGYRLTSDILNARAIARLAGTRNHIGRRITVVPHIDSTNAELLRQAEQGAESGQVLLTEQQTRGRGRLGRNWYSEPGQALTFSLLLRPSLPPEAIASLPLVIACAMHQALHDQLPELQLKWPNDLLWQGAKLGGILTEMRAEPGYVQAVVIGIGLNIRPPQQGWPDDLRQPAVALHSIARQSAGRNHIAAQCLQALDESYALWLEQGFAPFRDYWWRFHAASDQRVRVYNGREYIEGLAKGLDHDGALLLQTGASLQRIVAGDLEVMA